MSVNETQGPGAGSPSPAEQAALLQELIPKLGLEYKQPGKWYRRRAQIKFFLPRILALCVLAAVLVLGGTFLFSSPQFLDMSLQENPDQATATFRVNRHLLLESVTAELDGRPVGVIREEDGSYRIDVTKNGSLSITASTSAGQETVETLSVSAIDEEPPHISRDEFADGDLYIYFTDGDGSGINWDTVTAMDADTGAAFALDEIEPETGYVRFAFPKSSVRILLEDNAGNPLAVLLDLLTEQDAPG